MKKKGLKKIPNSNKYKLDGLNKTQIEQLKNKKDNSLYEAILAVGGASLLYKITQEYLAANPTKGITLEEIFPVVPIEEENENPTIVPEPIIPPEELLKIIDIDTTIDTFEELEIDEDLIDEVITPDVEEFELDAETEEFLNSDELLDDLNNEEYDDVIINDDFIEEDAAIYTDDEGILVEEDNEVIEEFLQSEELLGDLNQEEHDDFIGNNEFIEVDNEIFETDENGFLIEDENNDDDLFDDDDDNSDLFDDEDDEIETDQDGFLIEDDNDFIFDDDSDDDFLEQDDDAYFIDDADNDDFLADTDNDYEVIK